MTAEDAPMIATIGEVVLADVRTAIQRIIEETFPGVAFSAVWVRPRRSAYGDVVLDICAVYEGEAAELQTPGRPAFLDRVAETLGDMGVTAVPVTRFIAKDDAGDWKPEGF